jgi:glycosyltransferase involved in cell wall biosynthesis
MPSRRLRVAVVARAVMPIHGVGGLERSVRDLVRHLALREVDVTLIVPPPALAGRPAHDDPFASPRIRVRHVPYLTFPFANRRGTTILDRSTAYLLYGMRAGRLAGALAAAGDVDLVHGFGASVLGYARQRAQARRRRVRRKGLAPLVFNPQGLEEFGATAAALPALKRIAYLPLRRAVLQCARAADCIIATDTALEPMVTRHLRPAPGQLRTVPNGIDLVEASSAAGPADGLLLRQRHGLGHGELVWLSVARLEENKGLDVLAEALARAARMGAMSALGWRWVIVGAGPNRRAIERAIDDHGISSNVIFAGRTTDPELHAWYEAASAFVHPTLYEGSSLVTLEAMAHRRAVIATRAGGLPDKVRPGVNGWLVEPGDAAALAAALDAAARAAHTLPAMGTRSREIVEHEFAWSVLVDRQLAVYDELLAAGAR